MKVFFAFALRVSPLLRLFRHSKVCLLSYYVTDIIVITIVMALAIRKRNCFEDKSYALDTDESLAKNKSNFCTPRKRNITLDNYIDFLTKFPLEELLGKYIKRCTLTKEEEKALQELREDSRYLSSKLTKEGQS